MFPSTALSYQPKNLEPSLSSKFSNVILLSFIVYPVGFLELSQSLILLYIILYWMIVTSYIAVTVVSHCIFSSASSFSQPLNFDSYPGIIFVETGVFPEYTILFPY